MSSKPKVFKDCNGREIKPGDVLIRRLFARRRERPGHRRVALDMMGNEVVVNDEGGLVEPVECWVKYKVSWSGACMTADRVACSDLSLIHSSALVDKNGKEASDGAGFHWMSELFDSTVYEIL